MHLNILFNSNLKVAKTATPLLFRLLLEKRHNMSVLSRCALNFDSEKFKLKRNVTSKKVKSVAVAATLMSRSIEKNVLLQTTADQLAFNR